MKIQIQIEVKPGTQAQAGTAQRLAELAAIQLGLGEKDGEIKTEFGSAKFTASPDAPAKSK